MTLSDPTILVLLLVVVGGMAWAFAKGGPLVKVSAIAIAVYMCLSVAVGIDGPRHSVEALDGVGVVAVVVVGLLVLRYASALVPVAIVTGLVLVVADGASIIGDLT